MLDDFHEHGVVLAVLDGRFLPIEHLKISQNSDAKTVQSFGNGSLNTKTTASSIDIGIRTKRRPHVRREYRHDLFIRNRKYKITVRDAVVQEDGATMDDLIPTYDVELNADTYTVTTASESFI